MKTTINHGQQEAIAQLDTITYWKEIHDWAEQKLEPKELSQTARRILVDETDWEDHQDHDTIADCANNWVLEDALEIQVRSDWHALGDGSEPNEFYILLCTGGPAVRIRGELEDGYPRRCWLEYQDWGTPWTQHVSSSAPSVLKWYASQFCWEVA